MAREKAIKVLTHDTPLGQYQIGIWSDSDPMNPREWDNIGTMVCSHRRYNLGDGHVGDNDDWMCSMAGVDWDAKRFSKLDSNDIRAALMKIIERKYYILPLHLYDHSGITMSTSRFSCPWDSGQVGWIYMAKADCKKHGFTPSWLRKNHKGKTMQQVMEEYLTNEVKTYDSYLTGDVYGYEVFRPGEEVEAGMGSDSCWGYYGYNEWKENGLLESAVNAIECDVRDRMKAKQAQITTHIQQLKAWIRNKLSLQYRKPLQLEY